MEQKTVKVPNIGCDGCVNTIKHEVGALPGVVSVEGNVETKIVTVQWGDPASWATISDKLTEIDYAPEA